MAPPPLAWRPAATLVAVASAIPSSSSSSSSSSISRKPVRCTACAPLRCSIGWSSGVNLAKEQLKRVSSRPVWMRWSAVACGLWSRAKSARSGFEPSVAYGSSSGQCSTLPSCRRQTTYCWPFLPTLTWQHCEQVGSARSARERGTGRGWLAAAGWTHREHDRLRRGLGDGERGLLDDEAALQVERRRVLARLDLETPECHGAAVCGEGGWDGGVGLLESYIS